MTTVQYTTLEECKQWLNIPDIDTSNDALITQLITNCSDLIDKYIGYQIYPQTDFNRTLDGTGNFSFILPYKPIQSITSLIVNGYTIPPRPTPFTLFGNGFGYVFNYKTSVVTITGYRIPPTAQIIQVSGVAGYNEIPWDITQAATELVAFKFKQRQHIGTTSITKQGGLVTETTNYIQGMMPPEVKSVLDMYKRTSIWVA